jgi:large repetitive protein
VEFQERSSSAEDERFFIPFTDYALQGAMPKLWTRLIAATNEALAWLLPAEVRPTAPATARHTTPSPLRSSRPAPMGSSAGVAARLVLPLLLLGAFVLGAAAPALALNCSEFPNGIIDGNFVTAPSQVQIDQNCTIRNFPTPNVLSTNFSFYTQPGGTQERWLVIFDNVVHTGNMSCNATHEHKIWFTNGSSTKIQEGCQNLLIPVEKIDKQNPPAQTTATIGVPFTYRLTIPVLYDPATGVVIRTNGSLNQLHGITIWDDLNATGADLTYLDHRVFWAGTDTEIPHTFSNVNDVLTFAFPSAPPFVIPPSEQIIIEITVVPDNTPRNAAGTQFINTAKWEFGRLIDGVFYSPLPGEWGRTAPMTIVKPDLVTTKTGPATVVNLGEWAEFAIDVWNRGSWASDAWNVRIVDQLPSEPANQLNGGMCNLTPVVTGVTLGGAPLTLGSDYELTFAGCELSLTLRDDAGPIEPNQRLNIAYRTKVDADTDSGAELINLAAASQWSNAREEGVGQVTTCPLADGTPATADCQDAHELLVVLSGYFFEKTVANPVTGEQVTTAMPGDTLRYTLRLSSIDRPFNGVSFYDDLNAAGAFVSDSLVLVSYPQGADISHTGNGILDIRNLDVAIGSAIEIKFDIRLAADLPEGFVVLNQAELLDSTGRVAVSDDPNIDGPADPAVEGDEDPTRVVIYYPPPLPLLKETTQATATIGEEVSYRITVPGTVSSRSLYNIEVTDLLDANLEYVGATVTGGVVGVSNTSTAGQMTITIAEIPAGQQAQIVLRARVRNLVGVQQGVAIDNTAAYSYANIPGGTRQPPLNSATVTLHVVEPHIAEITKSVNASAPTAGEIVRYSVTLLASSGNYASDLFDVAIVDELGPGLVYHGNPAVTVGSGVGANNTISAPVITGNGSTTPQLLTWSLEHGNADIDIAEGTAVTISYDVRVLDSVLANQDLSNSVVARWTSLDGPSVFERHGADGSGGLNDYVTDAATTTVTTPDLAATIAKQRSSDTFGAGDDSVRIGDLVEYTLTIAMPEGTLGSLVLTDTLPQGLQFAGITSINGSAGPTHAAVAPFAHAGITAAQVAVTGDPASEPTVVTWTLGAVTNQPNDGMSNDFVIVYRARVLNNVFAHSELNLPLTNAVVMTYATATGSVSQSANATITVLQPQLTVSKSSSPASGSSVAAGSQVTYTIDIHNSGTAPAYDVVLRDILPAGLRAGGVTMVSTLLLSSPMPALPNLAPVYDQATGIATWNFDAGVYQIPADDTLRVVYRVMTDTNLGEGLTLTNQATVDHYYSFDNAATPTLGGVSGERESYGPTNTASTTLVTGAMPTKTLLSPAAPAATIGQEVVYRITVPGTASSTALYDVEVTDLLDANLEYLDATVTGVNAAQVSNTSTPTQLTIAITEIPAGAQAVIELRTRVRNLASAQQGTQVPNAVTYTYANSAGGPAQPALSSGTLAVTIVEPQITNLAKTANKSTVTASEVVRYSVTLTAGSDPTFADVFDVALSDDLSLGLVYAGNPAVTVGSGVGSNNTIGAPVESGDGSNQPQTLRWSPADGNADIDIAAGTTVTISYDVRVLATVAVGQLLANSVVARWTSLDGPSDFERTGADGIGGLNDYVTAPVTSTLTVADHTRLSKAIVADSYDAAPSTAGDKVVRIGDLATYRLTLSLGEGTTRSVRVADVLPAGMAYAGLVSITPAPGGTPFTYSDLSQPAPGTTGTLVWELGNVVNTPSNDGTPVDRLVIEYRAQVLADAGIIQTPATTLTNTATLGYLDAGGSPVVDPARLVASDSLTLHQPVMSPITKSDRLGRIGSAETPLNVNPATDVMQFRLAACNSTGLAPAYNGVITDLLASQLDETSLTAPVVTVGGTVLAAGTDYLYTPPAGRGGTLSFVLNAPVNPGQCLSVDYDIGFHTDFGPNQSWSNSAALVEYWSLPAAAGQKYTPAVGAQFHMTNQVSVQSLVKTLTSVPTATIGEEVSYLITVPGTAVNAALDEVVVSDTLHAAFEFVAATATLNDAPLAITPTQSGQTLTWALGSIPAGQQVQIELTLRVANNDQANAGTSIVNRAVYSYAEMPAGAVTEGAGAPLTIVEPVVAIVKRVAPATPPTAGDILTYTVSLTAAAGAGAYDTTLVDTMSLGLGYVAGSARVGGGAIEPVASGDGHETGQTLTWNNGFDIAAGATVTVTYQALVLDAVVAGQALTNSATARWTSLAGPSGYERTGADGPGGLNDYVATASADPLTVPLPTLTVQKSVDKAIANPGDRLVYTLVIANPSNIRVTGFALVDVISPLFQIDTLQLTPETPHTIDGSTLSIDTLSIEPQETKTITFAVALRTNLKAGTVVLNQAELRGLWPAPIKSNQTQTVIPANGVVYDSVSRQPLGGVTLTLLRASNETPVPASCFVDAEQQHQVTPASGVYKFDLLFTDAACPAEGEEFILAVTAAGSGHEIAEADKYRAGASWILPPPGYDPIGNNSTAFPVPACPGTPADAVPATPALCEALASESAPANGTATTYYLHLVLNAEHNQIFNNHIPVDPAGTEGSSRVVATVRVLSTLQWPLRIPRFDCHRRHRQGLRSDRNVSNGQQDDGETGLAGVRVVTARGSDRHHRRARALPSSPARWFPTRIAAATSSSSSTIAACRPAIASPPRTRGCSAPPAARCCASTSARRFTAWWQSISPRRVRAGDHRTAPAVDAEAR